MSKFYVGQPVVCVNGTPFRGAARLYPNMRWPEEGRHYRIRAIYPPINTRIGRTRWEHLIFVLVSGLHNAPVTWSNGMVAEAAFWEARFEPATEISSLRDITVDVGRFMGDDGPRVDRKIRRRKKENA